MRYIYNGVDLMPVETYEFDIRPVYDDTDTDYCYTRASILTRAVVNGQAELVEGVSGNGPGMSYAKDGDVSIGRAGAPNYRPGVGFDGPPGPGIVPNGIGIDQARRTPYTAILKVPNHPLLTHAAIRHRLSTPRGKLYVFSGPGMETGSPPVGSSLPPGGGGPAAAFVVVNIESPFGTDVCDCKNGPTPRLFGVHTALGDANTLLVDWGCETYFNEGDRNGVHPLSPLLSNRFSQSHAVNDDGFTTIKTEGLALFRTDRLYDQDVTPDLRRSIVFMPILQGFRRVIDYVEGRPDVTGIAYSYTDTQQAVNFVAGPYAKASKISAIHRQALVSQSDILGAGLGAYNEVLQINVNRRFAKDEEEASAKKAMRQLAKMIGREVRRGMGATKPGG